MSTGYMETPEQELKRLREQNAQWLEESTKWYAEIERLRASNIKLVGAIDMIHETLRGGNVEDLLLIINRALAEAKA